MADEWSAQLFEASFGEISLNVLNVDDDRSRAQAVHTYPFRDGAEIQDTGGEPRTTSVTLIFFQQGADGEDNVNNGRSALDRFIEFDDLVQTGVPQTFVHPLTGSYQALVGPYRFTANAQERSQVIVGCTFIEASDIPAVLSAGDADTITASVDQVGSAAGDVDDSLATATPEVQAKIDEQPVTVQNDAVATAQGWADDLVKSARDINAELNEITDEILTEANRLELSTDPRNYETWIAFQNLHASTRRAADAAIKTAPRLTEVELKKTTSLLALMTQLFGGRSAVDKYARTRELNDIPNPAKIPAGTKVTIEQ
jgi:prophage DNA circulation protein